MPWCRAGSRRRHRSRAWPRPCPRSTLSERGARVIVNDLLPSGSDGQESHAEAVAAEIRTARGEAVADHSDISSKQGGERWSAGPSTRTERSTSSSTTQEPCATRASTRWRLGHRSRNPSGRRLPRHPLRTQSPPRGRHAHDQRHAAGRRTVRPGFRVARRRVPVERRVRDVRRSSGLVAGRSPGSPTSSHMAPRLKPSRPSSRSPSDD